MRLPSLLRPLLQPSPSPATVHQPKDSTMSSPAAAPDKAESMLAKVALECGGDISASQEEILATSAFLGGDNALPASPPSSDEEVFATPPDATQQQEEEPVTMCTLPFTPTPPSKSPAPPSKSPAPPSKSPAPPSSDADADTDYEPLANRRRKPRVCTRKVRGARISTPTPSPSPPKEQQPEQQQVHQQQPEQQQPTHVDPLLRAVLMMPTKTATATTSSSNPVEDFLALCRQKGLI